MRFREAPQVARVATGAVRRQAQLKHLRPDLEVVTIRGNVDTRLRRWEEGGFDGMILALAGLKRLGRADVATEILSIETMLPAIGQGALALEARQGDAVAHPFLMAIDDPLSHQAVLAERAFLRALGGTCQTPIAAHCQVTGDRLMLTGMVVDPSGTPCFRAVNGGHARDADRVGQHLARSLLERGADKLLS